MKSSPSWKSAEHSSYRSHRRQMWTQILLPVVLGALLLMVAPLVLWLTRMGGTGDVGRWAAISTIWLLIPVMIVLVILLAVLVIVIYVANRVNAHVPIYGLRAQRIADSAARGTRQAAAMVRKPILAVRAARGAVADRFKRLRERA